MKRFVWYVVMLAVMFSCIGQVEALVVFSTDFSSGAPSEFSGITSTTFVESYLGIGTGSNVFGDDFLWNTKKPASFTTLTLTGLSSHTSIDLNFLLAIIDSWDGTATAIAPDFFNIRVDGTSIFSETFDNFDAGDQSYSPPTGVQLTSRPFSDLGFNNGWGDAAYDMGVDPTFDGISHTSSTLIIDWFASGAGWQGGIDESWAIDNVEVILNSTTPIPEPSTYLLFGIGTLSIFVISHQRRKKAA